MLGVELVPIELASIPLIRTLLLVVRWPLTEMIASPRPSSVLLATDDDVPGEARVKEGSVALNEGRDVIDMRVKNHGDRPIQVGSHYPFDRTNRALDFDRSAAKGRRLDIPAGTAVRFEPGDEKTVRLVSAP